MTASDWLATMDRPDYIERRMEAILALSVQIGLERAREMMEMLDEQRRKVIAAFGDENLTAQVRYLINLATDGWYMTRFNWSELIAEYAASVGKTVEGMNELAARRVQGVKEGNIDPGPNDEQTDEDEEPNEYGLPEFFEQMRIKPPLIRMDRDLQVRHDDAATDTSLFFERFTPPQG